MDRDISSSVGEKEKPPPLLYDERPWNRGGVYPFLVGIQDLERLDAGLLPEDCEALRRE